MSTPPINFRYAIFIFSSAHDKDTFISHGLKVTKNKKKSASLEEVNSLVQIAIEGLKEHRQKKTESYDKLQKQFLTIKDYLVKIDDGSKIKDTPHQIYLKLFSEIETEIKELAALEVSHKEESLKKFSDEQLSKIAEELSEIATKLEGDHSSSGEAVSIISKVNHEYDSKLQEHKITYQETKIRLAKLAAQQYGLGNISHWIKRYGITDQKALIEIAKLAAQKNGLLVSRHIMDYGITDQNALIEIAKFAAQEDGGGTSQNIEKYSIKDQRGLIEIAKLAAQKNEGGKSSGLLGGTSKYIKKYGITDQNALIEIAKLAAQAHGAATSIYIENYDIKDRRALIEIAKIALKQNISSTLISIKNYGIDDQQALIEIGKLGAQIDARATSMNIEKLGIEDQNALIEIAKLCAQKDGGQTSNYIKYYRIEDDDALIEIAKLAAQDDGVYTSRYIKEYGISDKAVLAEIAQLAGPSRFIQNFGIEDQDVLIEIAKRGAREDAYGISSNIQNYNIKDQNVLIEIAKMAAQLDGEMTSQFIEDYGIKDQNALIEIAKVASEETGTIEHIQCYGIKNETHLLEIFLVGFKSIPHSALKNLKAYNFSFFKEVSQLTEKSSLGDIQKAFRWPEEFSPIFKELSQEKPDRDDINFFIYLGFKLHQNTPALKDPSTWGSILLYKDNRMRYELADAVFALDEKQAKFYKNISSPDYLRLPALFICLSSQNEQEAKGIHDILKDRREFRDGMLQKALLDALHPLILGHHFKNEEIASLLKKAMVGNIKANLFSIQGTLSCGGENRLRKEAQNPSPDLEAAYYFTFAQAIPIKPVKDFSIKYEQTFGRCALPSAPLIYAGKLHSLSKNERDKALVSLGDFIHSVLEQDFSKKRYESSVGLDKAAKVDHLKMVFGKKPSLEQDWRAEVEKPLEDYLLTPGKISFDTKKFLDEKIVRGEHLSKKKFPLVYEYLDNKDPLKEKALIENFQKHLKNIAEQAKEISLQKVNLRNALSSLEDIEKIETKDKLDIEKTNKVKAGRLFRVLLTAKKQFVGLRLIEESLNDMEKLNSEDPNFFKAIQVYVDRFKKAASTNPSNLTPEKEEQQRLILLQKDIIDLFNNDKVPLAQNLNNLIKIQGRLDKSDGEFFNDIQGIVESLQSQKKSYEGYTIINTDRFDLMLLCGTQVQGSCQRIDGTAYLNKCLLAYLLDGKNRLIAILDKDGNIVARSILRLLWDRQNDRPALMQETVYSNIPDESISVALNTFAKAHADKLQLDLYRYDKDGTASLQSFGSIAPWEYVDSAEGIHDRGEFTITQASKA